MAILHPEGLMCTKGDVQRTTTYNEDFAKQNVSLAAVCKPGHSLKLSVVQHSCSPPLSGWVGVSALFTKSP